MKLLTVLAATAAAAAVAAALTISAGASQSAGDEATQIAACLRAHGATGAPSGADSLALKRWVAAHADDAAVTACMPQSAPPPGLLACLGAHGLNPPGNLFRLKPWMLRQSGTQAGKAALSACGVSFDAPTGRPAKAKDCGGGATAPVQKPDGDATPAG